MPRPDIAAIKKRVEQATEGPWYPFTPSSTTLRTNADGNSLGVMWATDDQEFVSAARQDIPDLLAYIEELEKEKDPAEAGSPQ